jgi:hypothetical protein
MELDNHQAGRCCENYKDSAPNGAVFNRETVMLGSRRPVCWCREDLPLRVLGASHGGANRYQFTQHESGTTTLTLQIILTSRETGSRVPKQIPAVLDLCSTPQQLCWTFSILSQTEGVIHRKCASLSGEDMPMRALSMRLSHYMKMLEQVWNLSSAVNQALTLLAAKYEASQVKTKINNIQKEIGQLKKVCTRPSLD